LIYKGKGATVPLLFVSMYQTVFLEFFGSQQTNSPNPGTNYSVLAIFLKKKGKSLPKSPKTPAAQHRFGDYLEIAQSIKNYPPPGLFSRLEGRLLAFIMPLPVVQSSRKVSIRRR